MWCLCNLFFTFYSARAAAEKNSLSQKVAVKEKNKEKVDDVPELDDAPPPSVDVNKSMKPSASPSLKLRERSISERKDSTSNGADGDDIQEVGISFFMVLKK